MTAVVPTRNRRGLLVQTIESVLAQRDVEIELIVVDEGSTDGTAEELAGRASTDPRVRVIRHDAPRGPSAARNAGLAAATAPWVAFCDDDDLWAPRKLATQVEAIESVPGARWSCVGAVGFGEGGDIVSHHRPPPSGDIRALLRTGNAVPGGGSGVLVATDLVRDLGGFAESVDHAEDFELAARLAIRSPVAAVDRPLVANRRWHGSRSRDVDMVQDWTQRVVEDLGGGGPAVLAEHEREAEEAFIALALVEAGLRRRAARRYVAMARRFRRWRYLLSATAAMASPSWLCRRHARHARLVVPSEWMDELASWFAPGRGPR